MRKQRGGGGTWPFGHVGIVALPDLEEVWCVKLSRPLWPVVGLACGLWCSWLHPLLMSCDF